MSGYVVLGLSPTICLWVGGVWKFPVLLELSLGLCCLVVFCKLTRWQWICVVSLPGSYMVSGFVFSVVSCTAIRCLWLCVVK